MSNRRRALLRSRQLATRNSAPPTPNAPLGSRMINGIVNDLKILGNTPIIKKLRDAQQQFIEVTDRIPGVKQLESLANKAAVAEDRLPSSVVARGGMGAAQGLGNAINLDPRLAMGMGLLIGGVHTSGPKKGKYKYPNQKHPKVDAIEDLMEGTVYPKVKQSVEAAGKPSIAGLPKTLPDGTPLKYKNHGAGSWNFENRGGVSVYPQDAPAKPIPPAVVKKQLVQDYGIPADVADDLLRYQPKPTPEGMTISREAKVAMINPDPTDLKAKSREFYSSTPVTDRQGVKYSPKQDRAYSVPLANKDVTITYPSGNKSVHTIEGARSIQERVRQIPGMEDVVIDSMQAHHRFVLKESTDFMQYFDDPSIVRKAYGKAGINPGDDVMQRIDLPVRLHQTDPSIKYDAYKKYAAHERLQARPGTPEHAAKTPIQAEPGQSRWSHLKDLPDDKARLKYIEQHISDLRKSERIGLEAFFQQFMLQPGREKFGIDPYIGNFGQQILAPHDPIGDKIRQGYVNRRRMKINGT